MKRFSWALVLFLPLLVLSSPAFPQAPASPPGIRNFTPVDATVACAGAVTPEAAAEVRKAGFVSLVNLRTAGEEGVDLAAIETAAAQAGLRYFHVPFSSSDPKSEPVDRFLEIARDRSNEPMLIACASGGRAAMMLAIKRVLIDLWSVEKAMAEVPALSEGMRPAVRQFGLAYLEQHGKR
jgi:uncharacterized protein (TIGR01244 family)